MTIERVPAAVTPLESEADQQRVDVVRRPAGRVIDRGWFGRRRRRQGCTGARKVTLTRQRGDVRGGRYPLRGVLRRRHGRSSRDRGVSEGKDGAKAGGREAASYSVYVIELRPEVMERKKVAGKNAERREDMPCAYVGRRPKRRRSASRSTWPASGPAASCASTG